MPDAKFCPTCGTPIEATQAPSVPYAAEPALKLAFWGERFVAWLIDVIIIGLFVGILGLFTWFATGAFTWWSGWPSWIPFFNFNFGGVLYFLYWMLLEGAYGQSLGKMIMRIRVTRLDGNRVNMGQSALQSLGKAFLLPLDLLIGWILWPKRKQRLFSHLAETVVIEDRRR